MSFDEHDEHDEHGQKVKDGNSFKAKARLKQSMFRVNNLKCSFDTYGNVLSEDAGRKGENFYNGFNILDEVKKRYPKFQKSLYCNMLRSEHIPFNLFCPLKLNSNLAISVLKDLLGISIKTIDKIIIEYAPSPKSEYLDDNTSFDTYIEYSSDGKKGIIGIEVKYTETSYPYGSTEKERMFDNNSIYNSLTREVGIYNPEYYEILKTKPYKQMWRNQLLGEAILIRDKNFHEFTSVLFYPSQNKYIKEKAHKYRNEMLNPSSYHKFVPVTYEEYLESLKKHNENEEYSAWIAYLKDRYIV